ncbi:unnamed protein product, partial [Staurois parvus]
SPIHGKSRRCRLGHVISCLQSQLFTCKQGNAGYRHFSPLEQCQLSVLISATCQCPSVPHQCHISVPTSAH